MHELTQAETVEGGLKRQIFAERHEMHLVVAVENMSAAGNDLNGVEVQGAAGRGPPRLIVRTRGAGDENRILRQNRADFGKGSSIARQDERECRLRPDEDGGIVQARTTCPRPARG